VLLVRKALFAVIVVMLDHRVALQVSLSCALLVTAYIVQQRLQPFMTSQPLSSRLNLTSEEIQAILAREKSLAAMREGSRRAPGGPVPRRRSTLSAPGPLAEHSALPAGVQHNPRLRKSITHLSRVASARMVTQSLSIVIDYNQLVGPAAATPAVCRLQCVCSTLCRVVAPRLSFRVALGAAQENAFLVTSTVILVLGMVFSSRGFAPGSSGYQVLTMLTALLVVGSCAIFLGLLTFEISRSAKARTNNLILSAQ
jgi:hypothetical protein